MEIIIHVRKPERDLTYALCAVAYTVLLCAGFVWWYA